MEWGCDEVSVPRVVEHILGLPIEQLACGVYTTIALTKDGDGGQLRPFYPDAFIA